MGMTIAQKILARAAGRETVDIGENVPFRPDHMMAYDFPGYTDVMFAQMHDDFGIRAVEDPSQYVIFIDHMLTKRNEREREIHRTTREWCEFYGIALHEAEGIGHQVMVEKGYVRPGGFLIHFDGHISGAGALGALGWGVRRDLIEAWVTGQIHLDTPATTRFNLTGELRPGVEARDVLHHIIHEYGADGCAHQVMEIGGPGLGTMGMSQRQTFCGMAMFTGAVSAIIEPDEYALDYARKVGADTAQAVYPDHDATYHAVREIDLSRVEPQVVLPGSARSGNTRNAADVTGTPITRAFIGSCASGRIDDIRSAAEVLDGRHVASHVELNIVPTSKAVLRQAESEGLIEILQSAGAVINESTCDFCFGYQKPLAPDENCISTGVLNISGRMGSTAANVFMGSASTVAASAVAGHITPLTNPSAR